MHGDIVDGDNVVIKDSPWREMPIAAILKVDNMYGKQGGKLLYKCIPYNKHLPVCLVPYEEKQTFSKKRVHKYVLVKVSHWRDKHPLVKLTQTFGSIDELSSLYDYLLFGLRIHTSNQRFTKEFMSLYKQITKKAHINEIQKRYGLEDRTALPILTIDGETTQDFDDAIGYVSTTKDEVLSIYISNTVLWMDYLNLWDHYGDRVSSIYLPDRVVNMLPNKMGTSVCGLVEGDVSVAFAMDLHIRDNVIYRVSYHNVLIRVDCNYRYQHTTLLKSSLYQSILTAMETLDMKVENSYKCIEKLMIYFNSKIGDSLASYKKGIYRYCSIEEGVVKKVPLALQDYMKWQDTHSGYALYNDTLTHYTLGVRYYTQMSSPIRRIVDMINMIEFQLNRNMCTLSQKTLAFKDNWLSKVDTINDTHRAIKQLESQTKLLKYYTTTQNADVLVHEAYIVCKLADNKYKLYIPTLQSTGILKVFEELPLYMKINCKLCLLQDDINIVQKIRFIKV
tara:strand:- start:8742 stop:10256 length:1515 start_codon:yes stop_codon:yes gene_type:complete